MKLSFKLIALLAIGAGLLTLQSCSDESGDDTDPTPVETSCYLTSSSEVSQGSNWPTTYTYDASNNLASVTNDDITLNYSYTNGTLSGMTTNDGAVVSVDYKGGDFPSTLEITYDGEKSTIEITRNGDKIVTVEYYYEEDGVSELEYKTELSYNSDGTINSVSELEYDPDTKTFETYSTIKNITSDDKENPYITSLGMIIYTVINEDYENLGKGNVLTAQYDYYLNDPSQITNSYTYNNDGFPVTKQQTGFSDVTDYTFSYDCK